MTKAYGFNPIAAQAGLWSTDPLWQAEVSNNSLTTTATSYHYLHTDHLGTPMLATTSAGQTSWKGISEAFGLTRVDNGSQITMNLRFPGQYWDAETNSHYNYFRDYQPHKGRYLQRDPIGLRGGINTFGYVQGNPLSYVDTTGRYYQVPVGVAVGTGLLFVGGGAVAVSSGCRARQDCAEVTKENVRAVGRGMQKFGEMCERKLEDLKDLIFSDGTVSDGGEGEGAGADSGDKDPSTPTGQRGSPIEVEPGTNEPTSIGGRDYSGHALDRMQGRGVPPSAVEDAIQNGTPSPGNTPGTIPARMA